MKVVGWIGVALTFLCVHLAIKDATSDFGVCLYGCGVLAGLGSIFWAGWKQTKIWYVVLGLTVIVGIPMWLYFVEHQN